MLEAFAATSADLVGPPVEVYLRGVPDEREAPETWLARRRDIPDLVRAGPAAAEAAMGSRDTSVAELCRELGIGRGPSTDTLILVAD